MEKLFGDNWLKRMLIEMAGALMTSIAIYNFAIPAGLPMAGFSGIAIIIHRLLSLPVGITTLVLNIPVALLCWKLIGRKFFARSIRCMVFCSVFTDYIAPLLPLYAGSRLIAAVCTGVIGGFGYWVREGILELLERRPHTIQTHPFILCLIVVISHNDLVL